jgi:hypothetical protein
LTNSFDLNFNLNIRWIKIEAYKNNRKPSPHYGRDNTSFPQALLLNNFGSRKINAIQKNLYSRVIVSILRKPKDKHFINNRVISFKKWSGILLECKFMQTPTWPRLLEPIGRTYQHLFGSILDSLEFQLCMSPATFESWGGCPDESCLPPLQIK